jgi:hypothetical protein
MRPRTLAVAAAAIVLGELVAGPAAAGGFITRKQALDRPNIRTISGVYEEPLRRCANDDRTFDLRRFESVGSFGTDNNLDIGNDCAAKHTVVVGGTITGTISHSLTWDEVKDGYDADGLRFEGDDWLAVFGLSVVNLEDGFAPRVTEGTQDGNDVRFLLAGSYMDWIRDDAIEDDELMSGVIRDILVDRTHYFLSARPSSGSGYTNPGMVVEIADVLVRFRPMPNPDADDGRGFAGIFKWDESAGEVLVSDSIFYLDEQPTSDGAFPPGSYSKVTIVLGPDFEGRYPSALPDGVDVTRDVGVWRRARRDWLEAHPSLGP